MPYYLHMSVCLPLWDSLCTSQVLVQLCAKSLVMFQLTITILGFFIRQLVKPLAIDVLCFFPGFLACMLIIPHR